MVNYSCERCGKSFSQKGHYQNHLQRKTQCKKVENQIIEQMVKLKIEELSQNGDITINNQDLINQQPEIKIEKKYIAKPILKWVGGKGQIIEKILKLVPKEFENYHEIFVGGGSVLLAVLWAEHQGLIKIKNKINAYDLNSALIYTYLNIQKKKDKLYQEISKLIKEYFETKIEGDVFRKPDDKTQALSSRESYYYWIRKQYNQLQDKSTIIASAYFIFLNKTCFRGMYREGPNGFNVPYGNYKNPKILEKRDLDHTSYLIQSVNFEICDFSQSFEKIKSGDFVYLDPPYAPENSKSFVKYNQDGFDLQQHQKLFSLCNLIQLPTKFLMSNSNVPLIKEYFSDKDFNYEIIECRRAINSTNPAAKTEEVLITNFE